MWHNNYCFDTKSHTIQEAQYAIVLSGVEDAIFSALHIFKNLPNGGFTRWFLMKISQERPVNLNQVKAN